MNTEDKEYRKELPFLRIDDCMPPKHATVLLHMNDPWMDSEEMLVASFDGETFFTNGKKVFKKHISGWAHVPCRV